MKKSDRVSDDRRVFLGFAQPPLISASEYICKHYRSGNELDLSRFLLVLPSTRSVQRLLQLLVQQANEDSLIFTPPKLLTIGEFPEHLYPVEKKLATDLCQHLAWGKALQESEPQEIEQLFSGATANKTLDQWQPFAKLISDLHKRLGNDVWSFSSVVREVLEVDKNFREIDRWRTLRSIQKRYYKILGDVDLWDKQAARNVAVKRQLCRTDRQVIMIGLADLNRATKMMLQQIRSNVTVLVAAPRKMIARFDEFGGIVTEQWLHAEIKFPSDKIRIVDTNEDQAFAVAHYINQLDDKFSADQITIGVADPDVQPQVERSLGAIGVPHRDLKGLLVKHTPPVKLMVAMLEFLDAQNFTTYSALVRHPDMYRWICDQVQSESWLNDLDEYQADGLPDRIEVGTKNPFGDVKTIAKKYRDLPTIADRYAQKAKLLNEVFAKLSKLLENLLGEPQPIANWTKPWCDLLSSIYGQRVLDRNNFVDQQTLVACREIYSALRDKQEVPTELDIDTSASKALQMAIDAAAEWQVIPPAIPDAIELAGWLDLALDDAPVVIVTGMNDEHVPTSENGHLFLPNQLCTTLGILDNDRRYARDAYAMTLINSVRDHVVFITGRRDLQGEPKKPSRLLFADDNEIIARRANAFFAYEGKIDSRYWLADPKNAPQKQQLPIPKPATNSKPLSSLSVTAFKEFIKCPYRFYLDKVLRLDQATDDWQEMDGRAFGNLAHEVLEDFGRSEVRNSTSEEQILDFLNGRLDARVKETYRGSRLPAVRIQVEQLRMRLERFAPLQAQRALQGWRIASAEEKVVHGFEVDGEKFSIKGTIDRVDVHEASGQVEIWDYKTSDLGDDPTRAHLSRDTWKDLQLPLYRHLVTEIESLSTFDLSRVDLGYVLLPKKLDDVQFAKLKAGAEDFSRADDLVRQIIRKIRAGKYWPPRRHAPQFSEAFAAICQDKIFERFEIEIAEETA